MPRRRGPWRRHPSGWRPTGSCVARPHRAAPDQTRHHEPDPNNYPHATASRDSDPTTRRRRTLPRPLETRPGRGHRGAGTINPSCDPDPLPRAPGPPLRPPSPRRPAREKWRALCALFFCRAVRGKGTNGTTGRAPIWRKLGTRKSRSETNTENEALSALLARLWCHPILQNAANRAENLIRLCSATIGQTRWRMVQVGAIRSRQKVVQLLAEILKQKSQWRFRRFRVSRIY